MRLSSQVYWKWGGGGGTGINLVERLTKIPTRRVDFRHENGGNYARDKGYNYMVIDLWYG